MVIVTDMLKLIFRKTDGGHINICDGGSLAVPFSLDP